MWDSARGDVACVRVCLCACVPVRLCACVRARASPTVTAPPLVLMHVPCAMAWCGVFAVFVVIIPTCYRKRKPDKDRHVRFRDASFRFYGQTFGQSVPSSGGPPVGLDWDWRKHCDDEGGKEFTMDIEQFEEFRGGIIPEDGVDDDEVGCSCSSTCSNCRKPEA